MQSILVRHNVEMGHRLSQQPDSKCYHLHGHSWWIDLEIIGELDDKGMVLGLDFGSLKQMWRSYLDENFDHHLCLNERDPLVEMIQLSSALAEPGTPLSAEVMEEWGIVTVPFDPTVENMARLWGLHAVHMLQGTMYPPTKVNIKVQEAATNAATWRSY